ncbi:MAG: transporter substrate-binding domain-containing protein [Deltaproteobacteria bacterium]|nr:transporter substrate-binding domain-containing protein [Deltaproteobacteria bacterium]
MKPALGIQKYLCSLLIFILLVTGTAQLSMGRDRELTLAVGLALPPYNIEETDSGLELDIVREALSMKGYTVKTRFVPFARVKRELVEERVDGALTITPASGIVAFYSDEHIVCENVVLSLKSQGFDIKKIEDLAGKRVVAFQDATRYLGDTFERMAKDNPNYREIADQMLQINLLFSGRTDAIVLDKNIFNYHRKHNDRVDTTQPVNIWHIFEPSPFRVAFIDKEVRDDFNEGLKKLRESGRYQKIMEKYVSY